MRCTMACSAQTRSTTRSHARLRAPVPPSVRRFWTPSPGSATRSTSSSARRLPPSRPPRHRLRRALRHRLRQRHRRPLAGAGRRRHRRQLRRRPAPSPSQTPSSPRPSASSPRPVRSCAPGPGPSSPTSTRAPSTSRRIQSQRFSTARRQERQSRPARASLRPVRRLGRLLRPTARSPRPAADRRRGPGLRRGMDLRKPDFSRPTGNPPRRLAGRCCGVQLLSHKEPRRHGRRGPGHHIQRRDRPPCPLPARARNDAALLPRRGWR